MPIDRDANAQRWLAKLEKLRVDRDKTRGPAPHKPLTLLAVIDAIEEGEIPAGEVRLGPALVMRVRNFWPIVQERCGTRPDVRLPFHHLSSDGVWSVLDAEGRPSRSRETSVLARIPGELMGLFADAAFRTAARRQLVASYFTAAEQAGLREALGLGIRDVVPAVAEDAATTEESIRRGRSARFKNQVVGGYRYTCVLTGHQLTTVDQDVLVEAAHIHAFSAKGPDTQDNGLALSPTAHVLFDRGLWSVTDDLRILVSPEAVFTETSIPGGFALRPLAGRSLHFAPGTWLRPGVTHLRWHREKRFRAG